MSRIGMGEVSLGEAEIRAANEVLSSGALRQGPRCEAFEQDFARRFGAVHAVSNSSGTAALHLAWMTFLEPGEEVLVPAFTFIATASTVSIAGGRPVFCDVDPETFLLDLEDAERRITERTRAICPVHLFGNVCAIEQVQAFAQKHGLKIVWDAAQAHGARYRGEELAGYGDFVCYSFYPSKNMFVGEGGMTCTPDADTAQLLRDLRTHGQTGPYYFTSLGLNYRMTDVEAAIGCEQLRDFDNKLAVRRRNAAILLEALEKVPGIRPQTLTEGAEHAWHQFCIVVDPEQAGCDRDTLAQRLDERGIATGIHYPRGMHQQPVFEDIYGVQPSLPVTEWLCEHILAVPVHHGLTEDEAHRVAEAIVESAGR